VPIRREASAIGIILLESCKPEAVSDEAIAFLSRLSDHASIAISNAQLYQVVQDANNAKSEFVSFVAHELKNPMTSIKGYTELLAAGAVGPVSAPQGKFLSTIRANIDRMHTLVSDLNDLSKIEAGRLRLDFKAFQVSEAVEETVRSPAASLKKRTRSSPSKCQLACPRSGFEHHPQPGGDAGGTYLVRIPISPGHDLPFHAAHCELNSISSFLPNPLYPPSL